MSLKDEKEKEKKNQSEIQSQHTQTNSKLTGTPSNATQNNLERQELDELKKQNELIIEYLAEIQENQNTREKEQKQLTSSLIGAAKDFRNNGVKTHNSFTHVLEEKLDKVNTDELTNIIDRDTYKVRDESERMLQGVRVPHEVHREKVKLMCRGIGIMLLVFMLFTLITTIGGGFIDSIHVDILQKAIASEIKTSEGSVTLVWYIAYGLPYIIAAGGSIYPYEWIRKEFEVFL